MSAGNKRAQNESKARKQAKAAASKKNVTVGAPKTALTFSAWFEAVLEAAEVVDKNYPVKGMDIYRPFGYYVHKSIMEMLGQRWEEQGINEVLFPAFIPYEFLAKEADHVKAFEKDVFWVTRTGLDELDEQNKLAMRPTSETAMYSMFARWINSHRDLPLKIHQSCQVYRFERKMTRSLIRVREIPWNEAHTAHATEEDALQQLRDAWVDYNDVIENELCFKGLRLRRPVWDQFPGGEHSQVMDTIMPCGRVLQTVGAHYLGQKFAKVFDIKFTNTQNQSEMPWMTCFGVSCRLMAAMLALNGDDAGLILPPAVAKYQVVIIPILPRKAEADHPVNGKADEIARTLREAGIRTFVDRSEKSLGQKSNYWEVRGIPIRIELGARDLENGVCVVKRRNAQFVETTKVFKGKEETVVAREAETVKLEDSLTTVIRGQLNKMRDDLRAASFKFHDDHFVTIDEYREDDVSHIGECIEDEESPKVVRVPFFMAADERDEAIVARAQEQEARLSAYSAEIRGFQLEEVAPENGTRCVFTGEPAKSYCIIARCY